MRDWKAAAKALIPDLPAPDADRISAPLDALEETFRPLARDLPPALEPDFTFQADEEGR